MRWLRNYRIGKILPESGLTGVLHHKSQVKDQHKLWNVESWLWYIRLGYCGVYALLLYLIMFDAPQAAGHRSPLFPTLPSQVPHIGVK